MAKFKKVFTKVKPTPVYPIPRLPCIQYLASFKTKVLTLRLGSGLSTFVKMISGKEMAFSMDQCIMAVFLELLDSNLQLLYDKIDETLGSSTNVIMA